MANTVEEIERRLYLLREKYNAGAISAEQFETEVEKLHFRDQRGVSWMIGAQSGQWYYHDGKQWVQAEPPRPQAAARPAAPAQGGVTATGQPAVKGGTDTQSGSRLQWILFGCVGLTIVLLILAIALIGAIYLTSEGPTSATPTSVALLPVPNLPTPTATFAAPVVGDPTPTLALANDTSVLLQEAKDLMAQSKYEEAVARYKKASELDPSQATIYARWARALRYQYPPQLENALGKAIIATQLDSANVEGLTELAWLEYQLGRVDDAIASAQRAVKVNASYAPAHAVLARIYLNADRQAEGIAEARQALELDSASPDAHLAMAHAYIFVDQPEAALDEIQSAIDLEPNVAQNYVELGTQLRRMERFDGAINAYQAATKLYNNLAPAYDGLGRAYFAGPAEYDKALEAFNRAVVLAPQNASAYSGAGYVYLVQGNSAEAQKSFEQALALAPTMQEAVDGLSKVQELQAPPTPAEAPPSTAPVQEPSAPLVADVGAAEGEASQAGGEVQPQPGDGESPAPAPGQLSGKIYFPVFHRDQESYDIYWHNADGTGDSVFLIGQASQPAASWDGTSLAFRVWKRDGRGLDAMKLDGQGGGYHRITAQSFMEDAMPAWSPDGGSIVFLSRRESDRQSRLYMVPSGGGQERALEQNYKPVIGITPSWLRDGRLIYSGCVAESCGLIAVNPDGAGPTVITDHWSDAQPANSLDGSRIAFSSQREGGWEIYAVNPDGSNLVRLTENRVQDGLPTWSPDGQTIAFASDEGGMWGIWAMNPDGSNRRNLFNVPGSIDGRVAGEDDTKSKGWVEERISWVP